MSSLSKWIELGELPEHIAVEFLFMLNGNIFAIDDKSYDKIYEDTSHENHWSLYKNVTHGIDCNSTKMRRVTVDNKNNDLYIVIYSEQQHKPYYYIINFNNNVDLKMKPIVIKFFPQMIINHEYHLIYADREDKVIKHRILNKKTNKYQEIEIESIKSICYGYYEGYGLIHIPNKNELLLIGGSGYYDIPIKSIIGCSLKDKKWKRYNTLPKSIIPCDCVLLTNDQEHVILLGGKICSVVMFSTGNVRDTDNVYVLNVKTSEIIECNIKCPVKGKNIAFITSDLPSHKANILIFGFLKEINANSDDNNINIPNDVINTINLFYHEPNCIHLFNKHKRYHFKINVNDILASCVM